MNKKRQSLKDLKVKVRGRRAEDYPMVYTDIEVQYIFWGTGLSEKAVVQAIELSEQKYCSATVMLGKTAKIVSSYRIIEVEEQV